MIRSHLSGAVASAIVLSLSPAHATTTVTFEDFSLGSEGYWNGSDLSGTNVGPGIYGGIDYVRDLTFAGAPQAKFRNTYNGGYWRGFVVSNHTDTTTPGMGNQYSSYAGGGASGSSKFLVCYDTTNSIRFDGLTSMVGAGASFTNTTYAALDTITGTPGFSKAFTDTDWFKLTISGYNAGNVTGSTELTLVNGTSFILNTWKDVDFSSFGMVDEIRFEMSSTDSSTFGGTTYINTPAYFAMDNFVIPEPSTLGLAALGGTLLLRRRRTANQR